MVQEDRERTLGSFFSCCCLERFCAGRYISHCQANEKPLMVSCCNCICLSLGIWLLEDPISPGHIPSRNIQLSALCLSQLKKCFLLLSWLKSNFNSVGCSTALRSVSGILCPWGIQPLICKSEEKHLPSTPPLLFCCCVVTGSTLALC